MADENLCDLKSQDPELVRHLAENGATVVILDFPVGSEFGIDMQHWQTGEKFRGVKMIPPGIHFIYYSNVNEGSVAPRSGVFENFQEKELKAFRWNAHEEILEVASEIDRERLDVNRKDLDSFLGPYPYNVYRKWISLSDKITSDLIDRLQPETRIIHSAQQLIPQKFPSETPSKTGLPEMEELPSTKLRFTQFPSRRHPDGASLAEITRCGMDGSYCLKELLKESSSDSFLGELQFAFLVFLCGQRFDGFEHWKQIVRTICTSEDAMREECFGELFVDFISVLHFQLKEVPSDFFVDIVSSENFLTDCLSTFFRNVEESCAKESEFAKKANRFKLHLTKFFKWDFDQENDEDQPQVVELD